MKQQALGAGKNKSDDEIADHTEEGEGGEKAPIWIRVKLQSGPKLMRQSP